MNNNAATSVQTVYAPALDLVGRSFMTDAGVVLIVGQTTTGMIRVERPEGAEGSSVMSPASARGALARAEIKPMTLAEIIAASDAATAADLADFGAL